MPRQAKTDGYMPNAESVQILDSAPAHIQIVSNMAATCRLLMSVFYMVKDNLNLIIDYVQRYTVICAEDIKVYTGISVVYTLSGTHEIDVSDGYYGKPMNGGLMIAMSVVVPSKVTVTAAHREIVEIYR